jgi:capsid portal protein
VANEDLATELFHFRLPSEDPYGVPRWVSQLPSMLGSRESEEGNLRYFEDNTVPPLMLTVAGGRLTQQSYQELTMLLQKDGVGRDRQHRILIVEAVPERESLDDTGTVSLKLDKLTDSRQNDALFEKYDDSNQMKVLSAFRLPGILVGRSTDHTYSTANTAQFIAEMQVFAPERVQYDEVYNLRLVNSPFGLGLKTVKLRSKAPSITNPESQVKGLTAFNVMGAMTPRTAVDAANQTLLIKLPQYPAKGEEDYKEWMDEPLAIRLAGQKPQVGQAMKSPKEKQIEGDGDLTVAPEHGDE